MMRFCLFFIFVLSFLGCRKVGTRAVTVTDTGYALLNNQAYPLVADLYPDKQSLGAEANLVFSCAVPAKGYGVVPLSRLNSTTMYFYDIYTSDYLHSSWPIYNGTSLTGHGNSNTFDLGNYKMTGARYYFLRGNNAKTTWKAVDRRDSYNISDWQTLTDSSRFMLLEIYRDQTVTINYFPFWFYPVPYQHDTVRSIEAFEQDYYTQLSLNRGGGYSYLYSLSNVPGHTNNRSSIDTLLLEYLSNYWVMVRQ